MDELEERKTVLLKACKDLFVKQQNSSYVLNLLNEKVHYDEEDCDGYCLLDDINAVLEEERM